MNVENFSVLISVYHKEKPVHISAALDSVLNQTLLPNEIILIKDGPLTMALDSIIDDYVFRFPDLFKIVPLPDNLGLGLALNAGLSHCTNELIARMDTDDICYPTRFSKQFSYIRAHPEISVVGCSIEEFNMVPGDLKRFRKLPSEVNEIMRFSKYRNPLNHPTVFFRKEHILKVGSYSDMPLFEDYFLWTRLLKSGYQITNLPEPLLHFRTGNDMIGRRHGISYVRKEYRFLTAIKRFQFINTKEFLTAVFCKLPVRLLPKKVLEFVYKTFLR